MEQSTLDTFVRQAADLLDRRSLLGGAGAALLAANGLPLAADAKKHKHNGKSKTCKKRIKRCRKLLNVCPDNPDPEECRRVVNNCCKKVCESGKKASQCLIDNLPQ